MPADLTSLYVLMKKSRLFEEAIHALWTQGLISGEMHMGTGEEAIIAGVVSQLRPEDAMAVDHRGSAAFLMRGVDPVLLLREMLGLEDGLCGGQGGHMHLFSKEHLSASSGIVGAAGPSAVGFALAAQALRPEAIAVAFFGEGAMNQGMMMESINLAAVWSLPVVFVCKDDGWAILTRAGAATRGEMQDRVRGLGAEYSEIDGLDVEEVRRAAARAIGRARAGGGPTLLHARCVHLEAHFLGLPLVRIFRNPLKELPPIIGPMLRAFIRRGGGPLGDRLAGVRFVISILRESRRDPRWARRNDPVLRARSALFLDEPRLEELEDRIEADISAVISAALKEVRA